MAILLQRVCPNDRFWTAPSPGRVGTDNAYPGQKGFGHEDWNFNKDDAIKGWVYGYVYWVPQRFEKELGPHDLYFWILDPRNSSKRLLVGYYNGAYFVTDTEVKLAISELESHHILQRRAEELAASLQQTGQSKSVAELKQMLVADSNFRVRVRPEDIEVLSRPEPLNSERRWGVALPLYRYYSGFQEVPVQGSNSDSRSSHAPGAPTSRPGSSIDLPEGSYLRFTGSQRQLIVPLHNSLSNAVSSILSDLGGRTPRRVGVVDLVFDFKEENWLIELKIAYDGDTRHAIREAMGQLLEYSLHPDVRAKLGNAVSDDARRLIVLDTSPSLSDIHFVKNLNASGFMVGLAWAEGGRLKSVGIDGSALGMALG